LHNISFIKSINHLFGNPTVKLFLNIGNSFPKDRDKNAGDDEGPQWQWEESQKVPNEKIEDVYKYVHETKCY
jgi:hypothetical protein